MPLTPFHFGAHACASLPFQRQLDVFVFLGANVVVDLEPLLVMVFGLDYPLHGYAHSLLGAGLAGVGLGLAAYPFRWQIGRLMRALRIAYRPSLGRMALSGALGAWLHVLFDAPLYAEMQPFFPLRGNPLYRLVSPGAVYGLCVALFVPAALLYAYLAFGVRKG